MKDCLNMRRMLKSRRQVSWTSWFLLMTLGLEIYEKTFVVSGASLRNYEREVNLVFDHSTNGVWKKPLGDKNPHQNGGATTSAVLTQQQLYNQQLQNQQLHQHQQNQVQMDIQVSGSGNIQSVQGGKPDNHDVLASSRPPANGKPSTSFFTGHHRPQPSHPKPTTIVSFSQAPITQDEQFFSAPSHQIPPSALAIPPIPQITSQQEAVSMASQIQLSPNLLQQSSQNQQVASPQQQHTVEEQQHIISIQDNMIHEQSPKPAPVHSPSSSHHQQLESPTIQQLPPSSEVETITNLQDSSPSPQTPSVIYHPLPNEQPPALSETNLQQETTQIEQNTSQNQQSTSQAQQHLSRPPLEHQSPQVEQSIVESSQIVDDSIFSSSDISPTFTAPEFGSYSPTSNLPSQQDSVEEGGTSPISPVASHEEPEAKPSFVLLPPEQQEPGLISISPILLNTLSMFNQAQQLQGNQADVVNDNESSSLLSTSSEDGGWTVPYEGPVLVMDTALSINSAANVSSTHAEAINLLGDSEHPAIAEVQFGSDASHALVGNTNQQSSGSTFGIQNSEGHIDGGSSQMYDFATMADHNEVMVSGESGSEATGTVFQQSISDTITNGGLNAPLQEVNNAVVEEFQQQVLPPELDQQGTLLELQQQDTPTEPLQFISTSEIQQLDTPSEIQHLDTPEAQHLDTPEIQQLDTPSEIQQLDTPSEIQQLNTPEIQQLDTPSEFQELDTPLEIQQVNTPSNVQQMNTSSESQHLETIATETEQELQSQTSYDTSQTILIDQIPEAIVPTIAVIDNTPSPTSETISQTSPEVNSNFSSHEEYLQQILAQQELLQPATSELEASSSFSPDSQLINTDTVSVSQSSQNIVQATDSNTINLHQVVQKPKPGVPPQEKEVLRVSDPNRHYRKLSNKLTTEAIFSYRSPAFPHDINQPFPEEHDGLHMAVLQ